ncbi:hypothetical protein [Aeromonas phage AS-yj]|uniref:Ryanodine receptor Ryr domain-containing protein n=7 Tax=Caudoviricetes TaxID=2731619 RepID=A0A291LDM1_9CAUD|nr:hypothetical protein F485_gp016 [Aeromonas phage CC2]YP_009834688.1 hypothetical protein HWB28_gp388 [Aeromonas phage AS-zj]YP_009834922.1 hypothetical protein HWB29_gp220 [Aeromonas phage AS-sw]ATI17431.1 hypothetical protein [Aeromonas phage AS-szw]ATI17663.1 hypothetical protein [Aeromonas phage AS-yj]QAX97871.1 hypothetical protein ASswx1_228 [Aeromonas phage Asswx_1]QAX99078.1 hypothetical protein assk_290 [Aeromonas phage Assk]QMV28950.1 hypothetical protein AP1_0243 [Aeromonas phag
MKSSPRKIARTAHDAIRRFNLILGDTDTLWKEEPEKVKRVWTKHVTYIIDHPDSDARTVHELWRNYKEGEGWIFGEDKSRDEKTHPCLTSYDELHEIEKMKYYIFIETVLEQSK